MKPVRKNNRNSIFEDNSSLQFAIIWTLQKRILKTMVTKKELEQTEQRLKASLGTIRDNIVELGNDIQDAVARGNDVLAQLKAKIDELTEISSVDPALFDDEIAAFDAFNSDLDALSDKAKTISVKTDQVPEVPPSNDSPQPEAPVPPTTDPEVPVQPDPVTQVEPPITPAPVQDLPPFQEVSNPNVV